MISSAHFPRSLDTTIASRIASDDLPTLVLNQDLTQSTIILGHKGIRNDDPNYAALTVANRILGGGFGDRLFNEVRRKENMNPVEGGDTHTVQINQIALDRLGEYSDKVSTDGGQPTA